MENFKIIKVFDCMTEELAFKIVSMLTSENGLPLEDAKKRVKEMLFVALDDNDNVIGSSSGIPIYVEALRGWFLYYRSYTSVSFRSKGMSYALIDEVRIYFNNNRKVNVPHVLQDIELKGIYAIFESPVLAQMKVYVTKAGLAIIGFTDSGQQIRVRYFDNAMMD